VSLRFARATLRKIVLLYTGKRGSGLSVGRASRVTCAARRSLPRSPKMRIVTRDAARPGHPFRRPSSPWTSRYPESNRQSMAPPISRASGIPRMRIMRAERCEKSRGFFDAGRNVFYIEIAPMP